MVRKTLLVLVVVILGTSLGCRGRKFDDDEVKTLIRLDRIEGDNARALERYKH